MWQSYLKRKATWREEQNAQQQEANRLAQTVGFAYRQRYDLPPTDPRYLASDDITMAIELKALLAFNRLAAGKPLPGDIDPNPDHGQTDNFDDIAFAIEHDLIPDDEWDAVDLDQIDPESLV